jgi:pilus assembly protein CpaB
VVVTVRNDRESISRTVISNIQVLTAGTNYDTDKAKHGDAMPAPVVTLLVTPADAERLALATTQGQIVLALRNPLDTGAAESTGMRMGNLLAGANPPPAPVRTGGGGAARVATPPPAPAPPALWIVPITRGTQTKTETVPASPGGSGRGGGGGK